MAVASSHFSYHKLYRTIRVNDVPGIEKAILFLGAQIHILLIWNNRTPMEYAARLGHLEQVKILLRDLERYFDINCKPRGRLRTLFRELIPYRDTDPELVNELINKYDEECSKELEEMVEANAFNLIEVLIKNNKEKYIPEVISICFQKVKTELFELPEWIVEHAIFVKEIDKLREKDYFALVIMKNDCDQFSRMLEDIATGIVSDEVNSVTATILPVKIPLRGEEPGFGARIRTPEFVGMIARSNQTTLLDKLLDPRLITHVLKLSKLKEDQLLLALLSIALGSESMDIVQSLLTHRRVLRMKIDWHYFYFDLVASGTLNSAEAVDQIRGRMIQRDRGRLYHLFGNENPILDSDHLQDKPASFLKEIVDTIDAFPRNIPKSICNWRKCVMSFPVLRGRPDLVEHFARYGETAGTEEGVVAESCSKSSAMMESQLIWDRQHSQIDLIDSITLPEVASAFLGETEEDCNTPLTVELGAYVDMDDADIFNLEFAVTETGKKLKLEGTDDDCDSDETYILVQKIETKRREALTLKKLCRTAIRRQVCVAKPNASMTDNILSLYIGNQIPKVVAKYLMYREEHVHQPLYYRLVKPVHSAVHRNRLDRCSFSSDEDWSGYTMEDYLMDLVYNLDDYEDDNFYYWGYRGYGSYGALYDSDSDDSQEEQETAWKVYAKYYDDFNDDPLGLGDYEI